MDKHEDFSFNKLITGLICNLASPRTWAWAASTVLLYLVCWRDGEHVWINTVVICHCIISVFFVGGKSLQDALNHMVKERMDVDIDITKKD